MPFLHCFERWTRPVRNGIFRVSQGYQWVNQLFHRDIDDNNGLDWYLAVLLHLVLKNIFRFFPVFVVLGKLVYHLSPVIIQIYRESTSIYMAQDWMVFETFFARLVRR